MAVVPYPSIDAGYIYDPGKKLDCLMSDFYEAENAQSLLFRGSIASLPYIIQQNPNDDTGVINDIRTTLTSYLSKYFDDVLVEVAKENTNSSTSYSLRLFVQVTQGNETTDLYSRLKINGTKLEESLTIRE